MKPNSIWVIAFSGMVLIAGLLVAGHALVQAHAMQHVEYLTLLVNCGGGFEAHAAWTEQQHVRQYTVCLDRRESAESAQTVSHTGCSGGDCGRQSVPEQEQTESVPDALRHWRL